MTCSKCGQRERAGKHRWCLDCQREARNASNAKRTVTNVTNDPVTNDPVGTVGITNVGTDVTPVTNAPPLVEMEVANFRGIEFVCSKCASHAQDVAVFEEQIAGLKLLNKGKDETIARLTARVAELEEATRTVRRVSTGLAPSSVVENMAPPKKGLGGQYTPHGAGCTCLACGNGSPAEVAETPCPYPCMKRHVHLRAG